MKKTIRLLVLLLIASGSILLPLVIGEALARLSYTPRKVYFPTCFEYHPIKKIALKKNYTGPDESGIETITTNSLGFRSKEVSDKKLPNEKRVAFIGDSITYGHGVESSERFSDIFEEKMTQTCSELQWSTINTGVPGYSIMHEHHDFTTITPLQPDAVVLQFTLNDLTEPFSFQKRLGGSGIDYHQVADTTFWHFYLSQRSALYLFFNDLSKQLRFGTKNDTDIQQLATTSEVIRDTEFVDQPESSEQEVYWKEYFLWFDKFADHCSKTNTPCTLVLSPYTFQLSRAHDDAHPQRRLAAYAQSKGMITIDLIPVFQQIIQQELTTKYELDPTTPIESLYKLHREDFEEIIRHYFLDHDHYTPQGHAVVADILINQFSHTCSSK
jgi:hypothetical protein